MKNMVFIGGVHGVGKTFFCNSLSEKHHMSSYSASRLISGKSNGRFTSDKKVGNISGNQNVLLDALAELDLGQEWFLLDGHFCLINQEGKIDRIPESTFLDLLPRGIILLVDSVNSILERLNARDAVMFESGFVEKFQNEELAYSSEIANTLNIPLLAHKTTDSLETVDEFLNCIMSEK